MQPSLTELAEKYACNKFYGDHKYGPIYERLFETQRQNIIHMCEIGIFRGNSARVWLDYFPGTVLYGVDWNEDCRHAVNHDRFVPIIKHQNDRSIWNEMADGMDLVVDDGSHHPADQIETFFNGFMKLRAGGLWIIEDCHTSFSPEYIPQGLGVFSFVLDRIVELQMYGHGYGDFYRARKEMRQSLGWMGINVFSIQVFKSFVVIEKAEDMI